MRASPAPLPPVPAPWGSCYVLRYSPPPPSPGDWVPDDAAHFLGPRYTESVDTLEQTNGHLARRSGDLTLTRQADWWVADRKLHLADRTPEGNRELEFDSLTGPALRHWQQTGRRPIGPGAVRASPVRCYRH